MKTSKIDAARKTPAMVGTSQWMLLYSAVHANQDLDLACEQGIYRRCRTDHKTVYMATGNSTPPTTAQRSVSSG